MASAVIPDVIAERREQVRAFMEEHVYPNEQTLFREDEQADALIRELRGKAKEAGLWAPHLPPEAGGSGGGFIEYAYLNEESAAASSRSSCSAARRPTRETARSSTSSAPTSRSSGSSSRSSPAPPARSSG